MADTINLCLEYNGIPYLELEEGGTASFCNDGQGVNAFANTTAQRKFICLYSDHGALTGELLEAYVGINWIVGAQHPVYSGLFVNQVQIKPFSTKGNNWKYAELTIGYKALQFNIGEPGIVFEDEIGVSGEVDPLTSQSVVFDDGTVPASDVNYQICYLTYRRTWKNVLTIPLSSVIAAYNCTNSESITIHVGVGNTVSVAAGFAVFQGIDNVKINYTMSGNQRFDVTFSMLVSPMNVNYIYNQNDTSTNVIDRYQEVQPNKYESASLSFIGV